MRILIADDEQEITRALQIMLERSRYTVDTVSNGLDALDYAETNRYDAIVLDIMMPGMSGIDVLQRIRCEGSVTPVMLLTAKGEVEDRIAGLDAGADDYLPKPFSTSEFLARVRALLRRSPVYLPESLTFGNLTLNCATYEISVEGRSDRLSNKEFQMMELLMHAPRTILSVSYFLEHVWGWESDASINVVWVNVAYLRRKLTALGANVVIRSVRGVGYVLEPEEEAC